MDQSLRTVLTSIQRLHRSIYSVVRLQVIDLNPEMREYMEELLKHLDLIQTYINYLQLLSVTTPPHLHYYDWVMEVQNHRTQLHQSLTQLRYYIQPIQTCLQELRSRRQILYRQYVAVFLHPTGRR